MSVETLPNGQTRVRIWRNGLRLGSQTFPKGTPKKAVKDWERKVKLGLINPKLSTSRRRGKIQLLTENPLCSEELLEPTLADFIPLYLEQHAAIEVQEDTAETKLAILHNHWLPSLGGKKLSEIKARDVRQVQADLWDNGNGYKPQTVKNIMAVVSQVFMAAVEHDFMEYNPCTSVKRPKDRKKKKKPPVFWSFAERSEFLSHCREHDPVLFELVSFAVTTGLRPGELRGLQREQLDFDGNSVMVDRAWSQRSKRLNDWTKGKIDRRVPVPPLIMGMLRRKEALKPKDFVFSEEITFSTLGSRRFKETCYAADVRAIRLHDLRHTFASHCVLKGRSEVEIRDLLGHSDTKATNVYMHLSDDDKAGMTDCLIDGLEWIDHETPKVISIQTRMTRPSPERRF